MRITVQDCSSVRQSPLEGSHAGQDKSYEVPTDMCAVGKAQASLLAGC